jgi:IS30 family transposase
LSSAERETIEYLLKNGASTAEIARKLGRHRSSIGREIERGRKIVEVEIKTTKKYLPLTEEVFVYEAKYAQSGYVERQMKAMSG